MLTALGWDVRRVRWDDWSNLELDSEKKRPFLTNLLAGSRPVGEELSDRPGSKPAEAREKLRKFREVLRRAEEEEQKARESRKIDFDI
mmetsp:Transcript_18233/g.31657  ORF Transcript_18233/g.31657 Transcript_18233/m.31657 type:complete len:88 (+) Transcript_18233:11-274(+)